MGFIHVPPPAQQIAAVKSIMETGELPNNRYWNRMEAKYEKNPDFFDKHEDLLAPLLKRDSPDSPILEDNAKHERWEKRYDRDPANFAKYHPKWMILLIKLDKLFEDGYKPMPLPVCPPWLCEILPPFCNPWCPTNPPDCPPCTPVATPEPGAGLMLGFALVAGFIWRKL